MPSMWRILWWSIRKRCVWCGATRIHDKTTCCIRHEGLTFEECLTDVTDIRRVRMNEEKMRYLRKKYHIDLDR